ncbi:MAG: hypothetical protein V3S12_00025 [Acidiferrobacterales bacterium]
MIKFLSTIVAGLLLVIAWQWYQPQQTLFDSVRLESVVCPGMAGAGATIAGTGGNAKSQPDQECNDRANVQLLLAAGMPDSAKTAACQTEASMRQFANVDNCMHADRYGWAKIMADVNAKRQACGGRQPKWYRPKKKAKFKRCIGALA